MLVKWVKLPGADMPDPGPDGHDAFISYASVDRGRARRIQRFLESWRDPRNGRRLKVFLDETDIRGGSLGVELSRAAHGARHLIACYSPATLESHWVAEEVRLFRQRSESNRIAVVMVGGHESSQAAGRALVAGEELRVHDLRRGRFLGFIGLGVKLELLRLLAFIADVDLRTLRDWHLRRTIRNVAAFVALAILPLWILLNAPVDDWEQLQLRIGKEPLYAVAAEANGEKLQVASRYRGAGPQGFRDYIQFVDSALARDPKASFEQVAFNRRLLPISTLPLRQRDRLPSFDLATYTKRSAAGEPFAGEAASGRFIVVVPLAPTQEGIDQETDDPDDFGTPTPTVKGALVLTQAAGRLVGAEAPDLSPVWRQRERASGPASPSRGLAVAWSPEGDVWLGMAGWDADEPGGLWLRRAGQDVWRKLDDFANVQSIDLDIHDGRTRSVLVAAKHLELWSGFRLLPHPTRMAMRVAGQDSWQPASAPPFGTRSEVELVGKLNGARLVRVEEHIFRERTIPLWRFLMRG